MTTKPKPTQANINQTLFGINTPSTLPSSSLPNKHDILTFKQIKPPSPQTKLYYDIHYKRIISITTDNMKIYNRTFTKVKKNCDITITNEYLHKITTNKQMTYALFYLICNPTPLIMCADLNTCEFTFMLKEQQFDTLLNVFFINEIDFCLIYTYQIEYYTIDRTAINIVTKLTHINYIHSNYLIQSYTYSYHIKLLIILLSDNSFQLFNLKERTLYHQAIKTFKEPFNLQGISLEISYFNGKRFSSLFNTQKKINDANEKIIHNMNNAYNLISKNQFYLEKIYEQFYFVFLSYEKCAIYFMDVSDLFSFPKSTEHSIVVEYKQHNRNSYLYFSDNLVFVINFAKKDIIIIDLHCNDKNKVLARYNYNTKLFNNVKEFMPSGGIFKVYNQQQKGDEGMFYYLYFNKELYYNKFSNKLKIKCLFDMSRRKHFKEFIIAKITDILTNSSSNKHNFNILLKHSALVKFIDVMQEYETIAMQLANMNCCCNNTNNTDNDIDYNRTVYSKHQIKPNKYEIERPTGLELLSKKQPILQSDLYTLVIHPIYEHKTYVSLQELLYIIYGFKCELNRRDIRVNGNFYVIMNCIVLDISKTMNVFKYQALITDIAGYNMGEIAEQLLHSVSNGNCMYKEVIVLAIEILLAYNKYYEVLEYLILNDIKKGIQFLMEYWTLLKQQQQQQHRHMIKQLLCKAIINKPHKRQIIIELLNV